MLAQIVATLLGVVGARDVDVITAAFIAGHLTSAQPGIVTGLSAARQMKGRLERADFAQFACQPFGETYVKAC